MVDYWIRCIKKRRIFDVICNVAILCDNEYVTKTCTCLIKSMTKQWLFYLLLLTEYKTVTVMLSGSSYISCPSWTTRTTE